MSPTRLFDRAIVRISSLEEGESARAFLQGLVTNDVMGHLPVYAGLLTAQGKALFDFLVWSDGDDSLLDCESDLAEELVKRLSLYRLRRKLAIKVDGDMAVHWSIQGNSGETDPRLPALGKRWLAPASEGGDAADAEWRAHRLSLGVTEGRSELGDILWLETNAAELNGVSFKKGCYIGQENTARMNWRQKINRRLVVAPLTQSDEKRRKIAYEELGLAVDHLRVADTDPALLPAWLGKTKPD
jgi:folate-binding protein YgfZ